MGNNNKTTKDQELEDFAQQTQSGRLLKPLVYLTVIVLCGWFIADWSPEIAYFFESRTPTDLGDTTELASKDSPDLSRYHNEFVSLSGIPTRRSESDRYSFYKLVGAHLYVQEPVPNGQTGDSEEEKQQQFGPFKVNTVDRQRFDGKGRLLAFRKKPNQFTGIRAYYRENYRTVFCVDLDQAKKQNASLDDVSDKKCEKGYLVQAGVSPTDHWYYLAFALGIALLMLVNLYWIYRWFRQR